MQDALAVQKSVQERRLQQPGTTAKIQLWIDQELEVLVSTVDAERTLEQLLEDRAMLHRQLDQLKVKFFLLHIITLKVQGCVCLKTKVWLQKLPLFSCFICPLEIWLKVSGLATWYDNQIKCSYVLLGATVLMCDESVWRVLL